MECILRSFAQSDMELLQAFVGEIQDTLHTIEPEIAPSSVVKESYTAFVLHQIAEHGGEIIFAVHDQEAVGFAAWWIDKNPEDMREHVWISDLFIRERHRGKGIGKQLLQRAEQWAKDHHLTNIRLGSHAVNDRATKLYKASGYDHFMHILKKEL